MVSAAVSRDSLGKDSLRTLCQIWLQEEWRPSPWPPSFHSRRQGLPHCDSWEAVLPVPFSRLSSNGAAPQALKVLAPNARCFARKASTSTSSRLAGPVSPGLHQGCPFLPGGRTPAALERLARICLLAPCLRPHSPKSRVAFGHAPAASGPRNRRQAEPCPQPPCAAGTAFRNARQSGGSGRGPGTCRQMPIGSAGKLSWQGAKRLATLQPIVHASTVAEAVPCGAACHSFGATT